MRFTLITTACSLALSAASASVAGGDVCGCPADLNQSGAVDGADLGLLLAAWGTAGADLNGNGTTDGADLGLLLAAWGACPTPANDLCGDAAPIAISPNTIEIPFCTTGATSSGPGFQLGACGDFAVDIFKDVWYEYTPVGDGTLTLRTCNTADFDTIIAAYKHLFPGVGSCPPPQGQIGLVSLIGCNDDTDFCTGNTSELEIDVLGGFVYNIRLGGFGGDSGVGILTANFDSVGDQCFHAINLGNAVSVTATGTTVDNPESTPQPCSALGPAYSEWFFWTAPCDGFVTIDTCSPVTDFDTVLTVWRETLAGGCTAILVDCNDDSMAVACDLPGAGSKSRVEFFADAGTEYYIQVAGYNGAVGSFELKVSSDCITP